MAKFEISEALRKYVDQLKGSSFEKNIAYMYVDTVAKVTVGVGHNLTAHGDWKKLPFVVKRLKRKPVKGGDTGVSIKDESRLEKPATADEKNNDYLFLRMHAKLGVYAAEQLAAYTTLEMKSEDIDDLFEADLQHAIKICRSTFGVDFDTYPVSCQGALIDIAFNCGTFASFHTIRAALKGEKEYAKKSWKERWTIAAQNSKRGAVNETRNKKIAEWFNTGAASSK